MGKTRQRRWFADFSHQWDSFLPGCNWRDFTLLHIGGEWSQMTGRVEASITLLGLSATVTYVYADTEFMAELRSRRDDLRSTLSMENPDV